LEIERADERIRETIIPYRESMFLKQIIGAGQPYRGALENDDFTESLLREIGARRPSEVAFFPIIAENKVVALLYCDNSSSGEEFAETEGLEIFINQAGLALEKSLLQKKLQEMQKGMKP
jgi:GAF domain-containing protein